MPNVMDVYEFYLEAEQLQGRSHVLTIAAVELREVWDPRLKQRRPTLVLRFHKARRLMTLNKTQARSMAEIGGEDYSAWVGMSVTVTPSETGNHKQTITLTPAVVQDASE